MSEHSLPILFLDENWAVRRAICALLEHHGFAVDCLDSAEAAITFLSKRSYAVVIIEVTLAQWGEASLIAHVGKNYADLLPRVVAVTADDPELLRPLLMEMGVCHLLTKPIHDHELLRAVQECLQVNPVAVH